MKQLALVIGGGGFLGINLCSLLLESGYNVRVLDNLSENIHPLGTERPANLPLEAEFIKGDLRNRELVEQALDLVDFVIHLGSIEGVSTSMFKIHDYTDNNCAGTSVLLEVINGKKIKHLIIASSMAVYGEGLYLDGAGNKIQDAHRNPLDLEIRKWNISGKYQEDLLPVPTPENKCVFPQSVYGLSKYYQETLCLLSGNTYNYPVTVLRFFNIYGPGQSLSNPSGDVLAKFGARLLNNVSPLLFEDGFKLRDFLHVKDAARACLLTLKANLKGGTVLNIGSGKPHSIREVALKMALIMEKNRIQPQISKQYRLGDIRNCFSDISKANSLIGFMPTIQLDEGMLEMTEWLKSQVGAFVYEDHQADFFKLKP